jgi:hypothetical protein
MRDGRRIVSRQNKVNPDHYRQAGRLTPDDVARERVKQREVRASGARTPAKAALAAARGARKAPRGKSR